MHWNEKIDLLKKEFSDEDFSVPHVDRKRILRKIESQFISRPEYYYDLNNSNPGFSHWWDHIKYPVEMTINLNWQSFLTSAIDLEDQSWIACEFPDRIMIYKARLNAILYLISTGQTWTQNFHVIQLKYQFLLSVRIDKVEFKIKASGDEEFEERLKRATTSASPNRADR
ncbi:MAG: hypothetical protein WA958_06900 [Tunicatimonas sp.]